jgi:hypothetical protein
VGRKGVVVVMCWRGMGMMGKEEEEEEEWRMLRLVRCTGVRVVGRL